MCTCKVQLNINTQLIITALNFTDFPDHVSKDYGYTFFVGFHGNKTYNTFVCGNTICSYVVFPQTKVLFC
jgi:hypothetical protein